RIDSTPKPNWLHTVEPHGPNTGSDATRGWVVYWPTSESKVRYLNWRTTTYFLVTTGSQISPRYFPSPAKSATRFPNHCMLQRHRPPTLAWPRTDMKASSYWSRYRPWMTASSEA